MTRFILSYVMLLLLVVAGSASARAEGNSKRPGASAPTLLSSSTTSAKSSTASPAHVSHALSHAIAHAAKKNAALVGSALRRGVDTTASAARNIAHSDAQAVSARLARVTAYWSGEGDYYTRHHISSTGVHLHQGHCAVDPSIIPYGSVVQIAGLGSYVAVDTGTAVVSRRAARESGHTRAQRNALVIDLYFETRRDGERFAANGPKFASITWSKPGTAVTSDPVAGAGSLIASGDDLGRSKAL